MRTLAAGLLEDLGYVAGIIDGEGSIYIARETQRNNTTYRLMVSVCNTYFDVMYSLYEGFGGSFYEDSKKRKKTLYYWRLSGKKAAEFIKLILPYLRIKQHQAEVALSFQSLKEGMGIPASPAQKELQLLLKTAMEGMNR